MNKTINQRKLYVLSHTFNEIVDLFTSKKLPNKILLSGSKGSGKATLAYHFINYVFSINEDDVYKNNLGITDMTAFTLCKENKLPIIVFDMNKPKNLISIIEGKKIGTLVY